MRRYLFALSLFMVSFFVIGAGATIHAASNTNDIVSSDVSYSIKGNADVFHVNEKTGTIKLANCVATSVRAHITTWEVSEEYNTQYTIQTIFDLLTEAEIVSLDEVQQEDIHDSEYDYYSYAGITLDFESPLGKKEPPITQKKGQGYGTIRIEPMDGTLKSEYDQLLAIELHLYTQKGISSTVFHVRSAGLLDLVTKMSKQHYDLSELQYAQSINICKCREIVEYAMSYTSATPRNSTSINDDKRIQTVYDALSTAEVMEKRIRTAPMWQMRFSMPDGTVLFAYIAEAGLASDWSRMKDWQDYTFFLAGDQLYTIDGVAQEKVFSDLGLPSIEQARSYEE